MALCKMVGYSALANMIFYLCLCTVGEALGLSMPKGVVTLHVVCLGCFSIAITACETGHPLSCYCGCGT
jgi:hypothetical protein